MMPETTTKTLTEQIKDRWPFVKNKKSFVEKIASDTRVNRKPSTIQNNWLGRYFSIPEEYQQLIFDAIKEETDEIFLNNN